MTKKRYWEVTLVGGEKVKFEAEQCSTTEGVLFLSNEITQGRFDRMVERVKIAQPEALIDLIEPPQEPAAIFTPGSWLYVLEVE